MHVRRAVNTPKYYPPRKLVPLLMRAGFYGVSRAGHIVFDHALVSALIERWRPETHTFHMPMGECTITLQDVALQLGLPIDGTPVIGSFPTNINEFCMRLFGKTPTRADLKGNKIKLSWLAKEFPDDSIPENATQQVLEQYTRAYIMRLIGGILFCDYSSQLVSCMFLPLIEDLDKCRTYSWGSAVLAYLYREMCQATDYTKSDIGGCIHLLHVWAWDRFPRLRPKIVRRHKSRIPVLEEDDVYRLPPPYAFR